MSKYETVIGLEVHVELSTKSKIFCGCSTEFGAPPNTNTCPVCLGHPGVLPVLNKQAVNFAMKAAMALNCEIAEYSKFDRKNYFYPDSPKAYQISQYDQPIGQNGWIEIEVDGKKKRIGITRLHLEEDAGKLNHSDNGDGSLVDFNRVGVPLIEIVSEPDLRSPAEARAYLEKLKTIIQYTGVSDVRMEEGSLRCDANISLRPVGQKEFGTKTEMKNLNSFKNVEKALEYEQKRQQEILDRGEKVVQQTLRWLEQENRTKTMRSKEEAHDYRYFPEPDLVTLHIDEAWKEEIRASIPELPDQRKERYQKEFGLSDYDAGILTSSKAVADFYEETVTKKADPKLASNWIITELLGYLNREGIEIEAIRMTPAHLAEMILLIQKGTISSKIAKKVFKEMLDTGKDPGTIVKEKGWVQISDEGKLKEEVAKVIAANPQSVEDFKNGKDRALGFLVGQVMKATRGQANPKLVNELILKQIQSSN
ncbi:MULTISPECIES: Asp-tRNA(Asn)/Glu-tRNA(Gln) amidotransferase subunit GatB [Thermoactinomyces]|jgi:aspartyl-tRNA(Asn)/glutamyl-tRNA(Gln) amidotransferase subunit B|uniref:Aspartyl/glutamyl-tRNA(Asn/Gln) amidotransferase subunit B n=1 Tax=Thermoactinomyces vulgaris TaxID=2026 RepID=A0ABS0QGK6_THEVU|nr:MULTISPECIES: Asp-tRNA(Asn)/Glu-tRNA(Gln) amidotransferase subunit GatB [Thermoactinomyces]KFZ41539.1 glutamyl-tRNA amidotransferase [Thermoactinomyces sp. Gus2-1]KYQ86388.1 glutamyl-tRNA amidotransferase [Thermoactinomyces sp. AS95]MBA4551874.1 Asp-tRNA(Asn)/Glu-tRNA(Gln) amidotransferase subunit GatB [Thermoactinomyces vulgaris]MBA4597205.1 Asp-tRNA(Asn)/Glu-tRNA(Gln) amidotransferase subunit GatB [Thermoactinomyces vulgaris]MBH8583380.1 Asp-tRNA(Asn)/Glu-tRNA(Gln) amidotransferase subuni